MSFVLEIILHQMILGRGLCGVYACCGVHMIVMVGVSIFFMFDAIKILPNLPRKASKVEILSSWIGTS